MTTFSYVLRQARGATQEGRLEAKSREEATKILRQRGGQIVELSEVVEASSPSWLGGRISKADIVYFTSQLAIMVDTGINLATALSGIADQTENPRLREMIVSLKRSVEGGKDFSSSLAQYPRYFDRTYIALIKASEQTGRLGEMLEQLASHMTQEMDNRRKVVTAMAYPGMMLVLAIGVTIFLLTFVMPKFEPLFSRPGVKLPQSTQVMLVVSKSLMHQWWMWLLGTASAVAAFLYFRRTPQGIILLDGLKIHLPVIGPMMRKVILSRSIHTLGIMVRSGVSMLDSIRLCAEVAGNYHFEQIWLQVLEEITRGNRICEALRAHPLVPRTLIQMIGSGEETGKLDRVLERVSTHYDREVEAAIKTTTSLIEPLMISLMGVVVGGIAMSLLLPIFSLSRQH